MRQLLIELNAYLSELPDSHKWHEVREARNAAWLAVNFGLVFAD